MNGKSLTLELPASVFDHLEQQALQRQRTVGDEVREILVRNLEEKRQTPEELFPELRSLRFMNDDDLRRVAKRWVPQEITDQLEDLNWKMRQEGLNEEDKATQIRLLREIDKNMLMRAQAALLLKERGHDISNLVDEP